MIAAVLSALGGAFELAGLGLVVQDIAADRRQARSMLEPREASSRPDRDYPPRRTTGMAGPEYASPAYSANSQLQGVMKHVASLEASVSNALVKVVQITDEHLNEALTEVETEMTTRDRDLRENVRYVLAASIRNRVIGAALLSVGIVLSTSGSVMGSI